MGRCHLKCFSGWLPTRCRTCVEYLHSTDEVLPRKHLSPKPLKISYWSLHFSKDRWLFKYLSHICMYTFFFTPSHSVICRMGRRMKRQTFEFLSQVKRASTILFSIFCFWSSGFLSAYFFFGMKHLIEKKWSSVIMTIYFPHNVLNLP